jgi:acyl carrier protein
VSQLAAIVSDILEIPLNEVDDDVRPATVANWTSLRHVQLMAAVEETYGIKLAARELRATRSVGKLRELLQTKGIEI